MGRICSSAPQFLVGVLVAIVLVEGVLSGSATQGDACDDDTTCVAGKGLTCIKPFADCTKGYCLCHMDATGWDTDYCTNSVEKGGACSDSKQCNQDSGQECSGSVCDCVSGETWDATNKVCSGGTFVPVGSQCATGKTCKAASGPPGTCTDGQACTCEEPTKTLTPSCASRLKYKDTDSCGGVEAGAVAGTTGLCATQVPYPMVGSGTTNTVSDFECSSSTCSCKSGAPSYVKLSDSAGFCKANVGTKHRSAGCSIGDHASCAENMACGKCPEDSATKCHATVGHEMKKVHSEECSADDECDSSIGLECAFFDTDPVCSTGRCMCDGGGKTKWWNRYSMRCENFLGAKDTPCYDTEDCNGVAGLTCEAFNPPGKKCDCSPAGDWDEPSKTCKGGANKKLIGETCTNATDTCLAVSAVGFSGSKRIPCDTHCKCPAGYKADNGNCFSRAVLQGKECVGTMDSPGAELTGGLCSGPGLECDSTSKRCKCPTDKPDWVRRSEAEGFCKARGSKSGGQACAVDDDCSQGYLCYECTAADGKKCQRGYTSGSTTLIVSVSIIAVVMMTSLLSRH